jgi:hypothetical protein
MHFSCAASAAHFLLYGGLVMFENSGQKIKSLAKILFAVGVLVAVIIGIILFCLFIDNGILAFLSAAASIGLGVLFSWLSVILLYCYGDMVQNVTDIKNQLCVAGNSTLDQHNIDALAKQHWICKKCGRQNAAGSTFCWNCKETPQ